MILDKDGTKVYADEVYTREQLAQLKALKGAARLSALDRANSLDAQRIEIEAQQEAANAELAAAIKDEIWVDNALAEFPTEEYPYVAPNGDGSGGL